MSGLTGTDAARVGWVDSAKGCCIILVVMMHSTLGVGDAVAASDGSAEGWLHPVVAWARPFRIPAFFLIAGLFLSCSIAQDWRTYLDRKVVHFAYFYLLWVTIQIVVKSAAPGVPGSGSILGDLALALVQPFGTLWFIHLLPIFFIVTKLMRSWPVVLVFGLAALLNLAGIQSRSIVIEEFGNRFVFFFAGYAFAPLVFRLADTARAMPGRALALLALWLPVSIATVALADPTGGFGTVAAIPGLALVFGFAGAAALVAFASLAAGVSALRFLALAGSRSLVIYVAFFLPMAATRILLVKLGWIDDVGTVSAIVTAAALIAPLLLHAIVRRTPARFLFERPAFVRLSTRRGLAAAE